MMKKWWHDKIAYQIYPKSFYDSNGDGIGDIPGIIQKLDYLAGLGIDIIWLSPVYQSPLADQGYDISDYYNIDPRFGTMEDMDLLIAEAKKRNISILMDLVVNHCSDEHEWFQKAIQDPDGKYGKFFYIEDRRKDTKDGLPSNWRSYFGGSCWEPLPGSDKLYLHLFHKKQPDLNWENPDVRSEIYKNINWWLEKGLGGFRIDAIINIKKALPFSDYPVSRGDGLSMIDHMLKDAKGIGTFLHEMKTETFEKYDAFTVGEVFNAKPEEIAEFVGDDGHFSTMFNFETVTWGNSENGWHEFEQIDPESFKQCTFRSHEKMSGIGFYANVIENHDEPRGVSRYIPAEDLTDTSKKLLATINLMLRGIPFIYQGQEIGMENTVFDSIEDVDDVSTLDQYETARTAGLSDEEALAAVALYSRDNARTPMQWTSGSQAGFTTGTPWLKLNPNYLRINVDNQISDEQSVFSYYKKLIALRKNPDYKETLTYGEMIPYRPEQHNLMAFYRKSVTQALLILTNFQRDPQTVELPVSDYRILLNNYPSLKQNGKQVVLENYQAVILELR